MKRTERKEDPEHYQTICDNLFPLHCDVCNKEFDDTQLQEMGRHLSTHYTRKKATFKG